jgi:nitrogen regulatory protein PII
MKRLTIIGDSALEQLIEKEAQQRGATGYTCVTVRGRGARGIRPTRGEGPNVKIEIIARPDVAQLILDHVAKIYFDNYAMIAFLDDVHVLRGEKFGA